MTEHQYATVHLCTNHPDNGIAHGFATGAHFFAGVNYDAMTELEMTGDPFTLRANPTCRQERGRWRVGRHLYRVLNYRQHVGNWCWDGFIMPMEEARRLASNLEKRGFCVERETEGQSFLPTQTVWNQQHHATGEP